MLVTNSPFCLPSPVAEMGDAKAQRSERPKAVQVEIHPEPFSPWQRLESCCDRFAASAVFIGRVRPESAQGAHLDALELTHYPGMCERRIDEDAERLRQLHGAGSVLVLHRVGRLSPGEVIVLVVVQADRRGPAQRCCNELLEVLKHDAPFWKREWCGDQGAWLSGNTPL